MAASASITMPVNLATPARAYDAAKIFARTPGASAVEFDAAGGRAIFGFEFPGNIDRLVERLGKRGLALSQTVSIAIPVRNLSGRLIDSAALIAHLSDSPAISHVTFDGKVVAATIVGATNAMRYMYEEIIIAGLMPVDMPTVAGLQEFIL